jgi:prefoldin subunit 5
MQGSIKSHMGYEKFEHEFPCPCGQGVQVAEWEEHDTWASGNEAATNRLTCPDCAQRLAYFYHAGEGYWVLKEDKKKVDTLEIRIQETEATIKKLTAELVQRHEQPWVDYINRLPNRMAKKSALGAGRGFLKLAVDPAFVEAEARATIKSDPKWVYEALKLHDRQIEDLYVALHSLRKEKSELEGSIQKIRVPHKLLGFKPFAEGPPKTNA